MTLGQILRLLAAFLEWFVERPFTATLRWAKAVERCLTAVEESKGSLGFHERREAFLRRMERQRLEIFLHLVILRQLSHKIDEKRPIAAHEQWQRLEKRFVSLLAYILPRDAREEWLGDLEEARRELIASRYVWWAVSLITWGRVVLLCWSLIKIKYQDLGFSKKRQRE